MSKTSSWTQCTLATNRGDSLPHYVFVSLWKPLYLYQHLNAFNKSSHWIVFASQVSKNHSNLKGIINKIDLQIDLYCEFMKTLYSSTNTWMLLATRVSNVFLKVNWYSIFKIEKNIERNMYLSVNNQSILMNDAKYG